MPASSSSPRRDIHAEITAKLVAAIEAVAYLKKPQDPD
jgi:hypothetical protein